MLKSFERDRAEMVRRAHAETEVRRPGPFILPRPATSGTSATYDGCCGDCVKTHNLYIDACGALPKLAKKYAFRTANGWTGVLAGEEIVMTHVSGCIFESDDIEVECDDGTDHFHYRLTVAAGVHDSEIELIDDNGGSPVCGEKAFKAQSKWFFDPQCGTKFGIVDRTEVNVTNLLLAPPCEICIYPKLETVTSSCTDDEWPETLFAELTAAPIPIAGQASIITEDTWVVNDPIPLFWKTKAEVLAYGTPISGYSNLSANVWASDPFPSHFSYTHGSTTGARTLSNVIIVDPCLTVPSGSRFCAIMGNVHPSSFDTTTWSWSSTAVLGGSNYNQLSGVTPDNINQSLNSYLFSGSRPLFGRWPIRIFA